MKLDSYGRSQTICIGRFLQLYAVCIHRQNHVATAKDDLNFYGLLVHFRNTRNRNWPFHKTVNNIATWFIKEANEFDSESMDLIAIPTCMTPLRVARDIPRLPFVEDRIYATVCGATPGRGNAKFPKNKTLQWERIKIVCTIALEIYSKSKERSGVHVAFATQRQASCV